MSVRLSACAEGAHTKQTILRNCGKSFLSLLELIAKIFCAVEIARTSAVLSNKLSFVASTATPFEQLDEEQGNTRPKQNPTYLWYVILYKYFYGISEMKSEKTPLGQQP